MQQRDTLTPLDARNSLLLDRKTSSASSLASSFSVSKTGFATTTTTETAAVVRSTSPERYGGSSSDRMLSNNSSGGGGRNNNPMFATGHIPRGAGNMSRENLVMGAAPLGGAAEMRQPTLPDVGYGGGGGGGGGYNRYQGGYGRLPY